MKKISLVLYFSLLAACPIFSQTQAEIDAMMKKAMAEIEKAKNDPKNKNEAHNLPNLDSIMKVVNANRPPGGKVTTKIAPSNKILLNALPIRAFNKAELLSYLQNLNIKLTEVALKNYGKNITTIPENAIKKSGTSIALWINGEPERAALAALKAAELYPDDATLLNNAAGILTSSGLSVNAIPILQYVLQTNPGNNTVLNNLGQAYLDLEEFQKAETYFLMAVRSYNYHPDANQALAIISEKKGDKAAAIKYAENSLKGAYRTETYNLLKKLNSRLRLMDLIRHRFKQPEHFNIHKYPLLPQCTNVGSAVALKKQHDAYNQMLWDLNIKYSKLQAIESKIVEETGVKIMMNRVKANRSPLRPFGEFATTVLVELAEEYTDKFILFDKYKQNHYAEKERLKKNYAAENKEIIERGGSCSEKNGLANRYLSQFALMQLDYQLKALPLYKNYLNEWSFWSYIASYDNHLYKDIFYQLVQSMILVLKEVNHTEILLPCGEFDEKDGPADELKIEEPDCPFPAKIKIPLGFVKLELSCDAYKLEVGEGVIGKLEYDRKTGNTTVAFGLGKSIPSVFFKGVMVEIATEAEVKGQFYITFDNGGKPTDLGVVWEAEMKLAAKVGEAGIELTLEEDELKAGFGNGVTMKDGGSFKAFIDYLYPVQPDAKQINKSVPLYPKQNG